MVFGEIVEPSTRALFDDDVEFTEYKELEWVEGVKIPNEINSLLIVETPFVMEIVQTCLLDKLVPVYKTLGGEIMVYHMNKNDYIVLCNNPEVAAGEVTSKLIPWINISKNIHAVTSAQSANYKSVSFSEKPTCFMHSLTTKVTTDIPRLESPNLVTGVGANVLSYSVHMDYDCCFYVAYIDPMLPVDSENSRPITELLNKINFKTNKLCKLQEKAPSNNIYI